jgi:succinate-acetate transporter protein
MSEVKFGNPAISGIMAMAVLTFLFNISNAGIMVPASMMVSGFLCLKTGDSLHAVVLTGWGGFFMGFGFMTYTVSWGVIPKPLVGEAMLVALVGWTIFALVLLMLYIKTKSKLGITIYLLLALFLVLLTIGGFTQNQAISHLGGYIGIITSFVIWYAVYELVLAELKLHAAAAKE